MKFYSHRNAANNRHITKHKNTQKNMTFQAISWLTETTRGPETVASGGLTFRCSLSVFSPHCAATLETVIETENRLDVDSKQAHCVESSNSRDPPTSVLDECRPAVTMLV